MGKLRAVYDLAAVFIKGFPEPLGAVIEVTKNCNLKCKHCYFLKQNYKTELTDREWLIKLKNIRDKHNLLQASWCGGEPLLRKDLIAKAMKYFKYNQVVTNGTTPLPCWPDAVFEVSVDGIKEFHEKVRGKNTYDKIKKNINRADLKINLAHIINKLNYQSLKDLVEEWSNTHVKGIHFGFYSPTKTNPQDDLSINPELRDTIINEIKSLKKQYGKFILTTGKMLDLMSSQNAKKATSNCLFPKLFITLGPDGKKKKCPVGNQAICSKCGHSPPYFMKALYERDFETFKLLFSQLV